MAAFQKLPSGNWRAPGRVDKLESQISDDLIQGSFCEGYRGTVADGGRRMGVL